MAIDPTTITPTLEQVASHIRNRTLDRGGTARGTFTATTIPTDVEATGHAARAARHVALELGRPYSTWDGNLADVATDVAALYAALQIETSYYGDGAGGESNADQLGRMYREQLAALQNTARDNQVGGRRMHSIPIVSAGRRRRPAEDPTP
ncbi:MAG: hypothetical protein AB7G37_00915 [Solirubrobacteraceae bacterium]